MDNQVNLFFEGDFFPEQIPDVFTDLFYASDCPRVFCYYRIIYGCAFLFKHLIFQKTLQEELHMYDKAGIIDTVLIDLISVVQLFDSEDVLEHLDHEHTVLRCGFSGSILKERVAVTQQGNWIGPELKNISEDVAQKMGMLPIPLKGVKEDCIATGISIYWCINSKSDDKVKEASKEFLNWLFQSDEGKQLVVDELGFVPAFTNYDGIEITDPLSKEVKRYIDEGKTMPWVMGGFPSGYEPLAAADIQGYFSGQYTFDQMVDKLRADFADLKSGN